MWCCGGCCLTYGGAGFAEVQIDSSATPPLGPRPCPPAGPTSLRAGLSLAFFAGGALCSLQGVRFVFAVLFAPRVKRRLVGVRAAAPRPRLIRAVWTLFRGAMGASCSRFPPAPRSFPLLPAPPAGRSPPVLERVQSASPIASVIHGFSPRQVVAAAPACAAPVVASLVARINAILSSSVHAGDALNPIFETPVHTELVSLMHSLACMLMAEQSLGKNGQLTRTLTGSRGIGKTTVLQALTYAMPKMWESRLHVVYTRAKVAMQRGLPSLIFAAITGEASHSKTANDVAELLSSLKQRVLVFIDEFDVVYLEKKAEGSSRALFDQLDDFGDDKSGSVAVVLCGSLPLLYSCVRWKDIRHSLAADVFPGLEFATDLNDTKFQPLILRVPAPTDVVYMRALLIASGYNSLSLNDSATARRILFASGVNGRAAQLRAATDALTAADSVADGGLVTSIVARARADLAPVHPSRVVTDLLVRFQSMVLLHLAKINEVIVHNSFLSASGELNEDGIASTDWECRFVAASIADVAGLWTRELTSAQKQATAPHDQSAFSRPLSAREAMGLCGALYVPDAMTEDVYPLTMLHMVMSLRASAGTRIETAAVTLLSRSFARVALASAAGAAGGAIGSVIAGPLGAVGGAAAGSALSNLVTSAFDAATADQPR